MSDEGRWAPTGVVPPGHTTARLTDDRWHQVQLIVQERTARSAPEEFRAAVDDALQAYQAIKYLNTTGGPKLVRQNLRRAREAALRLNDRLNDLDGNSRQILSEVPDGHMNQLYGYVSRVIVPLSQAEKRAKSLSGTKAGRYDFAPLNMGERLAAAIDQHFGRKFVSSHYNSLFAQIYAVVADQLGIASHQKAVRAALKFAQRSAVSDKLGPSAESS